MDCDCIKRIDKKLAPQNLRLATSVVFSNNMKDADAMLTVATEWLDQTKKKRGKKPPAIIVSYCPFCGAKVNTRETKTTAAVASTSP